MKRNDDFAERGKHLHALTDSERHERFWSLCDELVSPLLQLGYDYTSPAIERSVLLRMGFSSIEARAIADGCLQHDLLAHGAGNVVYRLANALALPVRDAGLLLADGREWERAKALFTEVTNNER